MTVAVEPIEVTSVPVVLSATVEATPLNINVADPSVVTVDVGAALAVDVTAEPVSVSLAVSGTQGIPGPAGGSVQRTTAAVLSGHRLVVPTDAALEYADATNPAHVARPVWLTIAAAEADSTVTLVSDGPVTEPTWNWTIGTPVYLGTNGQPTQAIPPGAAFVRIVAEVVDTDTIMFRPQPPIATQ